MDQTTPNVLTDALQVLDGYYRAIVTKVAEDIVDHREQFEDAYPGRAEEIVDRYGMHLQCLARIYADITTILENDRQKVEQNQQALDADAIPVVPITQTGQAIDAETPLEVGTIVCAEWRGFWWRASVVALEPNGDVRVHYDGWGERWDETVPRSRLQFAIVEPLEDEGSDLGR